MKRYFIIITILMLLTASILSGEAVKKSAVYFEFFYGYSFISPSDLNLNAVYNNRYFKLLL